MLRSKRDGVAQPQSNDQPTRALPPSPLFPPHPIAEHRVLEAPTKRAVWPIVLTAVVATIALLALASGGYALYHDKTTEVSQLKKQRGNLETTNAALLSQLGTTRGKLRRANLKLTNTTKGLLLTKRNLTKMRKDLVAANERAAANYGAGYSAGSDEGYSSGHSAGVVTASDSLTCSDDPDVLWLPYCN